MSEMKNLENMQIKEYFLNISSYENLHNIENKLFHILSYNKHHPFLGFHQNIKRNKKEKI